MPGPSVYVLNLAAVPLTSLTINGGPNLLPAAGIAGVSGGVVAAGIAISQSTGALSPLTSAQVSVQFAGAPAWTQQLTMPPPTFSDLYLACCLNGYILTKAPGKICLYGF